MRFFNNAGPVDCAQHYCLDPLHRIDLEEVEALLGQQRYFVLHAPRQTGKTSSLLALMHHLNAGTRYRCVYINVEPAQAAREDVPAAMQALLSGLGTWARQLAADPYPGQIWPQVLAEAGAFNAFGEVLSRWAEHSDRPLVLLIDEIDALIGDTLIALLRQLRAGYTKRPRAFPQSVVLCGVRDVRDYRIHSARSQEIITGGSAFNIKAESIRMGNFSAAGVVALYLQHSTETGQLVTADAIERIWDLTRGQPWLVNALGYQLCFRDRGARDRRVVITAERVEQAKEVLIQRRDTHLDQLADKLREPRVRRVVEPMLTGGEAQGSVHEDDIQYVTDLGLVARDSGVLAIANPIYREIIPRQLTFVQQIDFEAQYQSAWYIAPDGRLDLPKLLTAFQVFFREHSEHWIERFEYKEAGPQLLLQAFLQRIVNGGGRIEREYGLGRMRTDLFILWPYDADQVQKAVLELKVRHRGLEATIALGLQQTYEYLDRCAAQEAHLLIFDRSKRAWSEKVFRRTERFAGVAIEVWGM
ncbi:ATP-binding protein [Candidatus Thiodictyon syntrophicum]|jgi:hypothetical protein|uniref:Uncharacterized protein n=1 Tax=Candidatus Thiodictyon syntrophicum TaxID=1166950 RepID=A0A2K8U7I8_9GAMM|nr:ATP-binding protein [Candidatus Thiodictyon syntrophicum]AUB81542.1 hypothetical protein THSYN_11650 [Candidatus Thiodictyon syntrophicum]